MASLQSPVKGLEKLAQELRHERQKSTSALQDRNRQKIEIEKLKSQLEDAQYEIEGKQADYDSISHAHHVAKLQLTDAVEHHQQHESLIEELKDQVESHEIEYREQAEILSEMQVQYDRMKGFEISSAQTISKLENAIISRSDVIEEMEREVKRQQGTITQQEQRINDLTMDLAEKHNQDDMHLSKLQKAEVVAENYREMQLSSEQLKNELEETLERSGEMASKLREAQNHTRYDSVPVVIVSTMNKYMAGFCWIDYTCCICLSSFICVFSICVCM